MEEAVDEVGVANIRETAELEEEEDMTIIFSYTILQTLKIIIFFFLILFLFWNKKIKVMFILVF